MLPSFVPSVSASHLVLVASGVLAEDGLISEPPEANVEDESLLGPDGTEVALGVGLHDQVDHGHLLFMGQHPEHHQRGVAGQVLLVEVVRDLLQLHHQEPTRLCNGKYY